MTTADSGRPSEPQAARPRALITGGTSGIGAEFARQLAAGGHDLVLVGRDKARLASVRERLTSEHGVDVETISADLAEPEDLERVARRVADPDAPIDLLVNNAGFGLHSTLLDIDLDEHRRALDVMCLAVLALGSAAGRAMARRGSGRIINISSAASWIFTGDYSAIKAWVRNYSLSLGIELRGTGVRVTALCPGWVRTEFHKRAGIKSSNLPRAVWMDVAHVVRSGLAASRAGRPLCVPTLRWKVAVHALAQRGPSRGVAWFSSKLSASRRRP